MNLDSDNDINNYYTLSNDYNRNNPRNERDTEEENKRKKIDSSY